VTQEELYELIGKEVKLAFKRKVRFAPMYLIGTVSDFSIDYYPGLDLHEVTLSFDGYMVSLSDWEIM
jgi:hypothetical protein